MSGSKTLTLVRTAGRAPSADLAHALVLAPAVAAFVFLLAGIALPVSADTGGAAVWVPMAPANGSSGGPMVLVPYEQSVSLPAAQAPKPWVPDYQPHGSIVPAPPAAGTLTRAPANNRAVGQRLRNMPRPDDFGLAGQGLSHEGGKQAPATRGVTFSDLLGDAQWRRATAERLRAQPDFKPRF